MTEALPLGVTQGRVEILQFLRSREQVVFTLGFPVVLLLVLGSIFQGHLPAGVSFRQYFVTGMIASGLMVSGFQALAIQIPIERDRGVLKRLRGTPMPPAVYFIGKIIMVVFIAALETVLLLAIGVAFLGISVPACSGSACWASPPARCAGSRSRRWPAPDAAPPRW
jgi:ABC-2 type transport system permease protein